MPRSSKFKRDEKGIDAILKSHPFAAAVHAHAAAIAADLRSQHPDLDIVVDDYVTDRAASSVTIRDMRGRVFEVRDGILSRAATARGLEVHRK